MELYTWFLFLAVAVIAIMTPGPAILLAISNSIRFGVRAVFFSSLGNVCGLLMLSTAAIFGLGAVLKTSTTLFLLIKLFGAAYLIYLGIRQWRSKMAFFETLDIRERVTLRKSNRRFFIEGFLVAMTNPKAILFFTALFPQFVNTQSALLPQFFIMTLTFMAMSFLILVSYGVLAKNVKRWFSTEHRIIGFNRIFGGLFVLIGLGVLKLKIDH